MLKDAIGRKVIPPNPHDGSWLRITTTAVSSTIRYNDAFEHAEESLDILRIATPTARIHSPQYAIGFSENNKAFLAITLTFSRYPYSSIDRPLKKKLIERLNKICFKPSSDLEKRIKDALHFHRIGEIHSPKQQKLFYYVAAIERLILGPKMNLTHKFRERGAILLTDDPKERLELSDKLKEMYRKRSIIAHGEKTEYGIFLTSSSRSYVHRIVLKVLSLMDKEGLKTVSPKGEKVGKSLEEYVDKIVYS